ncbi:MAG TPA: hypothetical protein VII41_01845 [Steroidobacteraceae bacterium]
MISGFPLAMLRSNRKRLSRMLLCIDRHPDPAGLIAPVSPGAAVNMIAAS